MCLLSVQAEILCSHCLLSRNTEVFRKMYLTESHNGYVGVLGLTKREPRLQREWFRFLLSKFLIGCLVSFNVTSKCNDYVYRKFRTRISVQMLSIVTEICCVFLSPFGQFLMSCNHFIPQPSLSVFITLLHLAL